MVKDRRAFAVIEHAGKILVAKRSAACNNPGQWGFLGGRVDAGERPCVAILREIYEEGGVRFDEAPKALKLKHLRYFKFDLQQAVKFHLSEEVDKYNWVSPSELQSLDLHYSVQGYMKALYGKAN